MTRQKLFFALFLLFCGSVGAWALNDTVGVTPGTGKIANLIKFASNNVISELGVCDATVENRCATVTAAGAIAVDGSAVTQPVSGAVTANGAVNVTLTDCSGTVTTGGTAVNAFGILTTLHGFTIMNRDTTEVMWISFTTTAAPSGTGSYPLGPATPTTFSGTASFTSPPGMGTNKALSVVAATSAHPFSCTWW